jgi:sortase B
MNKTRIIVIVCTSIFFFSMYHVVDYFHNSHKSNQLYAAIQKQYTEQSLTNDIQIINEETSTMSKNTDEVLPIENSAVIMERFLPLLEVNDETVGWITVPNTSVDYPVMKTVDNDYYLNHDFLRSRSDGGSIFMDFRNSGAGTDRHTILYGHNMRDGSMFQGLMNYKERSFFDNNRFITFTNLYEEIEWEIFSAYVTDTNFYYIETRFRSNRDFVNFLSKLQEKSMFQQMIELTEEDQVLTLSTCSYEFDDARFVIHARKANETK